MVYSYSKTYSIIKKKWTSDFQTTDIQSHYAEGKKWATQKYYIILLIENTQKCKLIYSDRKITGCLGSEVEMLLTAKEHLGTLELGNTMTYFKMIKPDCRITTKNFMQY